MAAREGKLEWSLKHHLAKALSNKPVKVALEARQVLEEHGYHIKELLESGLHKLVSYASNWGGGLKFVLLALHDYLYI